MAVATIVDLRIRAGQREAARQALREVLAATRDFPGCLDVEVLIHESDPAHWVMIEHWESAQHSAAYSQWRAGPGRDTTLTAFLAAPPVPAKFSLDPSI
jgi:quinol monooxygenase YgiN